MQYTPLNLSPVLLETMFKLRISPAPLKKPAAFVKVGAAVIAEAAKQCSGGGVGRYYRSGFVHLDCGPIRTWRG